MDRVELRILGGLGNQLYQYSAARFIQKKYSAKQIIIDDGEYDTFKLRNLEINKFLNNKNVIVVNLKSKKNLIYQEGYHIYQKLYRMIKKKRPPQKLFGNKKEKYLCTYIDSDLSVDLNAKILHMYGYFVSVKTAMAVKDILMEELWLLDEYKSNNYKKLLELTKNNHCIAVSIRCGEDYIKYNWPMCTKIFYQKGLDYILMILKDKQYTIFIFADDIAKVKNEDWFGEYKNVKYIEGLSICESFELMRNCTDYVCSNSSFSWWGAFLSYNKNPIKVNPNKVFSGDSEEVDKLTFYDDLTILAYKTGEIIK